MKTVRARVVGARPERPRAAEPYRSTVDYARLFAEGAQFTVQGYDASMLSEPYDEKRSVIVVSILVPRERVEAVKTYGLTALDLWKRFGPMIGPMLAGFGAR